VGLFYFTKYCLDKNFNRYSVIKSFHYVTSVGTSYNNLHSEVTIVTGMRITEAFYVYHPIEYQHIHISNNLYLLHVAEPFLRS